MRFFLLSALLATTAFADTYNCNADCVGALYTAVATAEASGGGYEDGDMAVYGYMLYQGFKAAGADGAAWVAAGVEAMAGEDACDNDGSAAAMTTCLTGATADDLQPVKDWLADQEADAKAGYEFVLGAVSNQLAPGSVAANTWGGLDSTAFDAALKVYYIVGAWVNYVAPTVAAAFDDDGVACFAQVATAIGYSDGDDMVEAIANHGEDAFGADGLGHTACFGADNTATVADLEVTFADGTTHTFADVDAITAYSAAAETTANGQVAAALTAAGGGDDSADPSGSDASPAAMASAAVAFVALML